MDFKPGDRVRWTGSLGECEGTVRDLHATYLQVVQDGYPYINPTGSHILDADDLELVEDLKNLGTDETMDFKVGDRVRRKDNPRYAVGTVVPKGPDYILKRDEIPVRFDDYGFYTDEQDHHIVGIKELELADESDDVNHPTHYNSGKIEVWDFIYDQGLGYALGNATKYISRAGKKAGNSKVKDLRKAIAFLEREIRFEETGE